MDELEAISRLKQGDIAGLELFVRRYQVQALRVACLVTRDRSLAEDVVQDAFVRAYQRIGQFDSERPFGPWFLRSVVNAALKAASRAKRGVSLEGELQSGDVLPLRSLRDADIEPEAMLERAETLREVRDAIDRLSPNQRAAIVLRYYLGLTESEMADQLGCPRGTVKRRLFEARERLKSLLGAVGRPVEKIEERE